MRPTLLALAMLPLLLGGCQSMNPPIEQRTTQGPTALEIWMFRMMAANGREPTFDERRYWDDEMEARIGAYLREHPEVANSLEVTSFRLYRRVTAGMTREQVLLLLGPPLAMSRDAGDMEQRARRYWADLKGKVDEAWAYPQGWSLFFSGDRVADITQYLENK